MKDLGEIYSYSYHTNVKIPAKAGSSKLYGDSSVLDPTKLAWDELPENALTEYNNLFSIGPTKNEFVYEYTYGSMTRDFHWQELVSVDNLVVRQAWMAAFMTGTRASTPLSTISREIKDRLLKGGDMRGLVK